MGSLRGSCAQIDDQRHLILAGQPQKIADKMCIRDRTGCLPEFRRRFRRKKDVAV